MSFCCQFDKTNSEIKRVSSMERNVLSKLKVIE